LFSGHEQESLLRLQPLQTGLSSPQRFLRRLQVKQPVLTRVMGWDRGFFCTGMTFEHSAAKQAVEVITAATIARIAAGAGWSGVVM
jgi:hypothetical protein